MVDSTPLIPGSSDSDTKQGQRILGCCDSRRAVIVINSIFLALACLGFILLGVSTPLSIGSIILSCISILIYIIVICSALQFQYVVVIVAIVWEVISLILLIVNMIISTDAGLATKETVSVNVLVIFLSLLIIYVECEYVSEVRKGIMSRETHSREKYSW